MHICHVITRLIVGGAQENTVLTCRGLVDRGHEVTLVAGVETGPEGSLWSEAEKAGCRLIRVPSLRRRIQPIGDLVAVGALSRVFRGLRPDVVHTHSSKAGIAGRWAARRAGVRCIVHTIHGMSFNRTQPAWLQRLYRTLEQRTARYTARIVTVADAMTDQSVAAGIANRERFITIRSGMETDQYRFDAETRTRTRASWGVANDAIVVGTIARLFENKGYEEILDAMPRAVRLEPRLRFAWVGDGRHREAYVAHLERLGLADRVVLTGLVRPDEIPELVQGFDLLVHASRWEGLPRSVVQALLLGVPAISFDNDGAPEVVIDGETGLLVPFGDTEGLSSAMAHLAGDVELRRRLGAAGASRCRKMFDWQRMVEQLDGLYDSLCK